MAHLDFPKNLNLEKIIRASNRRDVTSTKQGGRNRWMASGHHYWPLTELISAERKPHL